MAAVAALAPEAVWTAASGADRGLQLLCCGPRSHSGICRAPRPELRGRRGRPPEASGEIAEQGSAGAAPGVASGEWPTPPVPPSTAR
ncbi:MAG: hypothetical protein AAFQ43_07955 [Bacteroidota bacterium]